jgi:uncharacterized membrane protein YhaH (DUF805 family)
VGIKDAVNTCFSKYATFSGRAARSEFWFFILFVMIVYVVLLVLGSIIGDMTIPMILLGIFALGIILPGIAVTVRRLHDQDKSGGWYFIQLVPAVGGIWFIVLMCLGGTPGPNRFGV